MKKKNKISLYLLIIGFVLMLTNSCNKDIKNNTPNTPSTIPVLSTSPISAITVNKATSGGIITSDGGSTITYRGVCWSIAPSPTILDNKTLDGSGTGSFISTITGLTPNTTYYLRAYAINNVGTGYGSVISFSSQTGPPILTTSTVNSIKANSAICGGSITSDGGFAITTRGVCWSVNTTPTISDNKTTDSTGVGNFISSISGLNPNTTYYVRAYATNSAGTGYGNIISFTTLQAVQVPVLTTSSISGTIISSTATCGGNITSDGGSTVTAYGVCWSTGSSPTISNSKTTDGSGTGSFISTLSGLIPNTTYYLRAYATNIAGTGYGNTISFTTFSAFIGQPYHGGILAYFLQSGDPGFDLNVPHGLIAAPTDQSTGISWCQYYWLIGTYSGIGTGKTNTYNIANNIIIGYSAALLCYNLNLNGYNDWYLPSINELNKLYLNKVAIGGFTNNFYWSSTENGEYYSFGFYFSDGSLYPDGKDKINISGNVRAIRSF